MSDEQFLFDDFSFRDSDVMDVTITARGREIPFQIKKGVSFADQRMAAKAAMKVVYKPDGSVMSVSMDEGVAQLELMVRVLRGWPFKEADGSMTPITRENFDALAEDVSTPLVTAIQNIIKKGRESLPPLESTSDAAS